jgi:restriction endonuclease S subunit
VRENEIDLERVKFVELKHDRIPSRMRLKEGDLLLTRKGSYGICAVVTKEHEKCTISSEIIKITLKPGINPYYIAVFMNSDLGKMQFRRLAVGAIMPGINHGALKSLKVLIPPRRVQDEIENQTKERIGLASRLKQEAKNLEGKVDMEIEAIILSKGQVSEN